MLLEKVSIIIVTFNANKTIREAIESVAQQSYLNKELIIIDGGSKDGTIETLVELQSMIRFWKSEKDKGIYDAMNKGIKEATGNWLLFLGADDKLCPGILAFLLTGKEHSEIDLLYGKIRLDDTAKTMGRETDYDQLIEYNIPHQAIFYRKNIFEKFTAYDLKYKILADYDLALKIFETPCLRKKFIDKEFSIFNSKGVSNRSIDQAFFTDKLAYFIKYHGISKKDKRLAKYYFFIGVALVLKKNYVKGFKNLLHPVLYGGRRVYYFFLLLLFILTLAGIGRKFKIA